MKNFSPLLLICIYSFLVHCQDQSAAGARASLSRTLVEEQSNADAETFGSYLSALAQFAGKDGSMVALQPRIFDLDTIFFNKDQNVDTNYARTRWERQLQTNIGFTPNSRNLFDRPVNFRIGLTFAFLNNKEIPESDYRALQERYAVYAEVQNYLTVQRQNIANDTVKEMVKDIINQKAYSCLPDFLKASIKKTFGRSVEALMKEPGVLVDSLSAALQRRPLLAADVNFTHGLGNRGETGVHCTASFSSYILGTKNPAVDPQIELTASYSASDDTTYNTVTIGRSIAGASAGINLIAFSRIEFKPGITYTNILSGLYADESRELFSPTAVLSAKLLKKLVIALHWSYDSDKAASTTTLRLKTSLD